jgi:hypothetical protein
MPADWASQTSLAAADYLVIARPLAVLLREAAAIEALVDAADCAPVARDQLRECLARAARSRHAGEQAAPPLGMLLGALLARLPSEDVLVAAGDLAQISQDTSLRQAADLAIDVALAGCEAMLIDQPNIGVAAGNLRRLLPLLDTLERPGPAARPARKQALVSLRRNLDASCRKRFDQEIETVLQTAQIYADAEPEGVDRPAVSAKPPSGQDIALLEAAMRNLRDFESAARDFGGGASYDRMIGTAAKRLASMPRDGQSGCDVARLIEILDGPEAGLAYLAGQAAS